MTYRLLDLFSGIGGFSLGLERSGGFKTVAFCEVEPFCVKVLNKHWPEVPVYGDIRELNADRLAADGIAVDAICGGFPCQDISTAGKGAGIEGRRSGLWTDYARLIGELRPRYVFVENVAALLGRGLDRVLGDLAALGYDAEWHCIPASALGAPHRRDRIWIIANSSGERCKESGELRSVESAQWATGGSETFTNTESFGCIWPGVGSEDCRSSNGTVARDRFLADASSVRQSGSGKFEQPKRAAAFIDRETVGLEYGRFSDFWSVEPNVGRVANGVPNWSHRLKALGNAVVPQIPELLGRAVLDAEGRAA